MRAKIWRGAREIGGSCVELAADSGDRIVLDLGKPLWAGWEETVALPAVPGLADGGDPQLHGVLISHPHLDHFGLLPQVSRAVPVYLGEEAASLLKAAAFFSAASSTVTPSGYLSDHEPLELGTFRVVPYLCDHSAYDAYSLLVEADGRRLFYTGDIRGHGRKARLFQRLLAHPPHNVNVLLLEGTHVRTAGNPEAQDAVTEPDVELSMADTFRRTHGLVLVLSSAQNIDRLVTVYRACKRAGRILAVDLYTATVAQATGRQTIPQPGFPNLQVFIPLRQRVLVKEAKEFARTEAVKPFRLFPEDLAARAAELVVMAPTSAVREVLATGALTDGAVIWSLWPGYLNEPSGQRLRTRLEQAGVPLTYAHASGHASIAQLQDLVQAMDPDRVVPIHSEAGDRYPEYFPRVERHDDGEWWTV